MLTDGGCLFNSQRKEADMKLRTIRISVLAVLLMPLMAASQLRDKPKGGERWVCTWATAQQLMPIAFPGGRGPGRGSLPPANESSRREGAAPQAANTQPQSGRGPSPIMFNMPADLGGQTVRMIVCTSLGGSRIRINLSNSLGGQAVQIGSAHIALHKAGGGIVPGTDRVITFEGKPSCVLIPGVLRLSDPVDLQVPPLADLAVSLYFPRETGPPANHRLGLHTAYISKGDTTDREIMPESSTTFAYFWLASIDVLAPADSFAIVALGDSITDGYATTVDANRAWPALLAKRLNSNKSTQHISVVNQGISGNQVLRDGAGLSALARFDRDVLSVAGVKWVVLLEGINDINARGRTDGPDALTSEDLIAGYRQIIERAHTHGIKVAGATLTPEEGVPTASERGEEIRRTVNQWIRTSGQFNAVVDFDAVLRDPARPVRVRPEFDPGDHIHPNDAGNQAMVDAFDLKIFRR
jgi:lysophospholipase L1-like esterase